MLWETGKIINIEESYRQNSLIFYWIPNTRPVLSAQETKNKHKTSANLTNLTSSVFRQENKHLQYNVKRSMIGVITQCAMKTQGNTGLRRQGRFLEETYLIQALTYE